MVATAFLPMRAWPGLLSTWVFSEWRKYFRFSYIFEENVSPYNNYVMAQFPHGACPIGTILAGSAIQTFWPEFNAHALVASFIFNVPGWRQMHAWVFAHPATRGWLMKLLTGGGDNHSCWAHLNKQQEADKLGLVAPSAQAKQQQPQAPARKAQKKRAKMAPASHPLPPAVAAAAEDALHDDSDHDSVTSNTSHSSGGSSSSSGSSNAHRVTAVIAPRGGAGEAPLRNPPHPLSGHLRHQPVVSDQPLHSTIGRKIGVSVGILVGGIAELFLADPDVEHIVVKKRKGFVRAAVETGSYLLPTYYFGQSVMLKFGPRWLRRLSRKLRTTFGFMYGPFGEWRGQAWGWGGDGKGGAVLVRARAGWCGWREGAAGHIAPASCVWRQNLLPFRAVATIHHPALSTWMC
jgi:hypothetical protein